MVTKPRTNTRTRKTQEVAHIYDTFIVGAVFLVLLLQLS